MHETYCIKIYHNVLYEIKLINHSGSSRKVCGYASVQCISACCTRLQRKSGSSSLSYVDLRRLRHSTLKYTKNTHTHTLNHSHAKHRWTGQVQARSASPTFKLRNTLKNVSSHKIAQNVHKISQFARAQTEFAFTTTRCTSHIIYTYICIRSSR